MSENNEKRMIASTEYEVIHAMEVGSREILIGSQGDRCYMKAEYHDNGIIGQYDRIIYSSDYIEIMEYFTEGINRQLAQVKDNIKKADYQAEIITPEQCRPSDYSQDITGEVVVIKASALRPEYRRGDMQLVFVTHGSGAKANPRGTSVFCYHLNDGSSARYGRHQIQGQIKEIPAWAKNQLESLQQERNPIEPESTEKNGGYEITMRIQVGNMQFVLGENPKAPAPYVTWQQREGRTGYDSGHYMTDRDTAVKDLNRRANNERANLSAGSNKRQREFQSAR